MIMRVILHVLLRCMRIIVGGLIGYVISQSALKRRACEIIHGRTKVAAQDTRSNDPATRLPQ